MLHGYDDPMATPEQLTAFIGEMNAAGADWQVHAYGGTKHAFTLPSADDPGLGAKWNPVANRRAWASMTDFLGELFG